MTDPWAALGVAPGADAAEVKSAFRRIALAHHPDRSKTPESARIFAAAKEAYEVLSDPARRAPHDVRAARVNEADEAEKMRQRREFEYRMAEQKTKERAARDAAERAAEREAQDPRVRAALAEDVTRLARLHFQGRHAQAETLALQILAQDARQPVPYAVLGDLARARGDYDEAARRYAMAAQFDPRNETYQKRYEELLSGQRIVQDRTRERIEAAEATPVGIVVAALAVLAAGAFALFLPSLWWAGAAVGGVVVGASLAGARWLDRLGPLMRSAVGGPGPLAGLTVLAAVHLGLAALVYVGLGLTGKAFHVTLSRWLVAAAGVGVIVPLASLAGGGGWLLPTAFAGGVGWLAGLAGWGLADAVRK